MEKSHHRIYISLWGTVDSIQISNVYVLLCHRPACGGLVMKSAPLRVCLPFISYELGSSMNSLTYREIQFTCMHSNEKYD